MKKSRFSEEHIIGILKEQQAGLPVAEICLAGPRRLDRRVEREQVGLRRDPLDQCDHVLNLCRLPAQSGDDAPRAPGLGLREVEAPDVIAAERP